LTSEWEQLAYVVKGTIKIAYWDTEQPGRRPSLLGEVQGTPTIRLYVPKPKQGLSNRNKQVYDYQYERKAKNMKEWADQNMPSYVEPIRGDLTSFFEKADRHGLPKILLFTSKARTASLTKYLTVEFRRRLLIAEVYPTTKNKALREKYSINDGVPALLVLQDNNEVLVRFEGTDFTRRKLHRFLSKYALKEPVAPTKKEKPKEDKVKVEL
jgi:hypothetical protein